MKDAGEMVRWTDKELKHGLTVRNTKDNSRKERKKVLGSIQIPMANLKTDTGEMISLMIDPIDI